MPDAFHQIEWSLANVRLIGHRRLWQTGVRGIKNVWSYPITSYVRSIYGRLGVWDFSINPVQQFERPGRLRATNQPVTWIDN